MSETPSLQSVMNQIDALDQYYRNYAAESTRLENQTTGLQRIGEWFSGSKRFSNDTMHTIFYEGVQERAAALAADLSLLPADQAAQAAEQAVAVIFHPIPQEERDVGGWMRFAAEPLCLPLLTYLPRERLQAFYEEYNRLYPKRLQFPAQVKLRREMERLLQR